MKKKVLFSIALVLILCMTLPSAFAAPTSKGIFEYIKIQIVQNTVYAMTFGEILYDTESRPIVVLERKGYPDIDWANAHLTTDGKKLYVIDPTNLELYRLDDDKLSHVVSLKFSVDGWMTYPVIQGNNLYILMRNKETLVDYLLYRYSLRTGECTPVTVEDCNFWEIALGAEGQLIGWDNTGKRIVAFDGISGKVIASTSRLPSWNVGGLCYDKENAAVCFLMDNELIRWNGKSMAASDYLAVESCLGIMDAGFKEDGSYVAIDRDGYHYNRIGKPLTILTDSASAYFVINQMYGFMHAYPDVNVHLRYYSSDKLAARAGVGDLILRSSQNVVAVDIPAMQELDSALLRADVACMYPQIQKYLKKDGKLYAYPIEIWPGANSMHMNFAYISPNAERQSEAVRFLEYYTRHMETEQRALRYPDCINDFKTGEEVRNYTDMLSDPETQFFKVLE